MPEVPLTPQQVYDAVHAGLLAERKRRDAAVVVVKESKERIKKAERMMTMLRNTFGSTIVLPPEGLVVVPTKPKPGGVQVLEYECTCGRTFDTKQGRGKHISFDRNGHGPIEEIEP